MTRRLEVVFSQVGYSGINAVNVTGGGGGGPTEPNILHPKKYMDLILCSQKNTRLDILDPKKYIKKIRADFSDPKKYTVKSSTQKNTGVENFRPKQIRRTPPSRLYLSNPPGSILFLCMTLS